MFIGGWPDPQASRACRDLVMSVPRVSVVDASAGEAPAASSVVTDRMVVLSAGSAVGRALGASSLPNGAVAEPRVLALLHRDDRACFAQVLRWTRAAPGESARLLVRLNRSAGEPVSVIARIAVGASGMAHVEIQLDDAAAARRAEAQIRQVVEGAQQAAVVTVGSRIAYSNPALARMLGFRSLEELRADGSSFDRVHPDDRATVVRRALARPAGQNPSDRYDFRLCRADGTVIWVAAYISQVTWNGQPASLAWLIDITDRKRTKEALLRSEKLFGTVFQASPAMLTLSRLDDGRFIDVNESFLRTLGFMREDVIGRSERELGIFHDREVYRRLGRGVNREEILAEVRTRDGQDRSFAFSSEILRSADRDMLLTVAIDVTDRRRSEAVLRRSQQAAELANRAKSEFLANMSHELRTPLNAIIGFSEVIAGEMYGPAGEPRYAEYARDIQRSGQHLLRIINDLLDLSKVESGKQELHETEIGLAELIAASIRLVQPRATAAGLTLAVEVPDGLPQLRADARLLKQLLINLLSNAVKFTPKGSVSVRAGLHDGAISIAVADTGIGMSAREIELALAPFGQVDSGLSRKHEGTGLGLPLARAFAELHGGQLEVLSTPGAGSTMTVRFPPERTLAR
jgi:PAS domain S-box-containing protein